MAAALMTYLPSLNCLFFSFFQPPAGHTCTPAPQYAAIIDFGRSSRRFDGSDSKIISMVPLVWGYHES